MTTETEETKMDNPESRKRRRISKNKKKNWRKFSDVKDVEEFLEDQRLQERTGGLVKDKTDAELFFVERAAPADDEPVKKKRKREKKPLRCEQNLRPDPKIAPARVPHNLPQAENQRKRKSARVLALEEKGHVTQTKKQAIQQRKAAVAASKVKRRERGVIKPTEYDLWGDDVDINGNPEGIDEHYLKVTRKKRKLPPKSYRKKPSQVEAIEVPHPGASYNPDYFEHQDLLAKATEVELKKVKEEQKLKRALHDMFPTKSEAPTEASRLQEMSEGLHEAAQEDGEEDSGKESDDDRLSCNPPVRRENKKTEQQRKKIQARKEKELKAENQKKDKLRKKDLFRIKGIKAEVQAREEELAERAAKKAEKMEARKNVPRRLGKLKYEDPDLELKLTDELEGSLRLLKPEGHLLEDRFHSLQKRNIIEPRKKAKFVRRYKQKYYEKKSHKEITL